MRIIIGSIGDDDNIEQAGSVYAYELNVDIDANGVINEDDILAFDPSEGTDTDLDGLGDNADKDDDNDLIPDSIELFYGLNPLAANDSLLDLDSGSHTNRAEYHAGTNLNNALVNPATVSHLHYKCIRR